MNIRRRVTDRPSVVEAAVSADRRLSAMALGVFCYLSGADPEGCDLSTVQRRFRLSQAELDQALGELLAAGYLDPDIESPPPCPLPPRRRRKRTMRPPSSTLLLHLLEQAADPDGRTCLRNREVCAVLGQTERALQRNLAILEAEGLVRRVMRDCGEEGFQREIWVLTQRSGVPSRPGSVLQ